nr:uncharacterized protein LOC109157602 [Ipomoea batatas]
MFIARVHLDESIPRFSQPTSTPHIHHLAYADAVIIFSTGRQGAICRVIRALKEYEEIFGQMVSFPKSAFYMHPRTSNNVIRRIRDVTRCIQKKNLARKRRREKGKDPIIDVGLANQAHTQEATSKDFGADLDDHLAKILDQEGVPQAQSQEEPQVQSQNDTQTPVIAHTPTRAHNEDAYSSPTQVEDSSTQGDASSATPTSLGLQTPVRGQGTGLCHLNTEQATIPTVSTVAQHTKASVAKHTRRARSASEQSNVAGFYREASNDDSDPSVAGRVAIFESAGHHREFAGGGGHGSPSKTSQVPFGGRITRSQVRKEQSSAAVGTPISSQSPSF